MVEVAVPTTGRIHFRTVWELLKLAGDDITFQISAGREGPGENRNRIVRNYLNGFEPFLLMVDDDVVPLNLDLEELTELNLDIIAIPCPIKIKGEYRWNIFDGPKSLVETKGEGLKQVYAAGTGCMLIRRQVLDEIDNPFTPIRGADDEFAVSEDYRFCEKANEKGFKIWAYWDQACGHQQDVDLDDLV